MKALFFSLLLLAQICSRAQNLPGFTAMCDTLISHSIPLVYPKNNHQKKNCIYLDAREKEEYKTSHIPGAIYLGYSDLDPSALKGISFDTEIYVYCSVGYRSEKIGERLKAAGYKKVYNLYGGIFNWANMGYPLVNGKEKPTTTVHGYSEEWSKWLNPVKCSTVLK